MGTVVRIQAIESGKPTILYITVDDGNAGKAMINNSADSFARENHLVPIEPVLAKIKVRPGKPSSPEIQRIQFPLHFHGHVLFIKCKDLLLKTTLLA